VLSALADASEQLALTNLSESLRAGPILVSLSDEAGGRVARARVRRAHAQALCYANHFDEALALLNASVQIASGEDTTAERGRARLTMLHALARTGRFAEAIGAGEAARAELASCGEHTLAAKADVNLGVVHRMREEPRDALEHFDRALPRFSDQPVIAAQIQSNRAEALLDLNEFAEAERSFRAALAVLEEAGVRRAASIVEGNLADLMNRQGRFGDALQHFERARRRLGDEAPGDVARLRVEQAETQAMLGLLHDAAREFREAIPALEQHGMPSEAARARAGLGRTLALNGSVEEASDLLGRAASDYQGLAQPVWAARTIITRAEVETQAGRLDIARDMLASATRALAERPADCASAAVITARLERSAGRPQAAMDAIADVLDLAERLNLPALTADLYYERGMAQAAIGQTSAAAADLGRAIAEIERLRGGIGAARFRSALLASRSTYYQDAFAMTLAGVGP
jgi:tetratricopeptide (TPR) repeat protein